MTAVVFLVAMSVMPTARPAPLGFARSFEGCTRWKVIANPTLPSSALTAVSGASSNDVWAVGSYYYTSQPIIEHWDGTAWRLVDHPSPDGTLVDVEAISADDAWAIGNSSSPIVEHWDGTQWTLVPAPDPGTAVYLYGISGISSSDAWMVGNYTGQDGIHPLAEHWDGTKWTLVSAPDGSSYGTNGFYDVSAMSPDDVWAVGYQDVTGGADFQPLVEHWDGTVWTVVATPPVPGYNNQLYGVSAVSSTDVWAVGLFGSGQLSVVKPLIDHWDGRTWSVVHAAKARGQANEFFAVSAVGTTDGWAAGVTYSAQSYYRPRVDHWDGSKWSALSAPSPGLDAAFLDVAMISSSDIWAVGGYVNEQAGQTGLIEHSGGCGALRSGRLAAGA